MNRKLFSLLLVVPLSLTCFIKPQMADAKNVIAPFTLTKPSSLQIYNENIQLDDNIDHSQNNNIKNNIIEKFIKKSIKINGSNLNTTEKSWFFKPTKDGTPSGEPPAILELLKRYSGYYLGDTSKKIIYLTFDEGYENGYSLKILDALKDNNVKAAFFVTTDYINRNKDIIKRMVAEGHLVCNHSTKHPSMALVALKDKVRFENEFISCEKAFEEVTGTKMPKFFRPPMGKYSELSLYYTQSLGYKSIFWSFAYKDWIPDSQPSAEIAKKIIMERTHNGGIFLLHAVSRTNAAIMDSILKEWKAKGFQFKTLNELP